MAPQGWLAVEQLSYYHDIGVGTNYYKSAKTQLAEATPTYQEVGARAGNAIVLVFSPNEGVGGMYYMFEKRTDGTVVSIIKPQSTGTYDVNHLSWTKESVSAKVTLFDETLHYDSLSIPDSIGIGAKESVTRPEYASLQNWMGAEGAGTTKTLVKQLGASQLYKSEVKYVDTQLTNIGYYIVLPIGTKVSLQYSPNATSLEKYTFTNGVSMQYKSGDGTMTYDSIGAIARGCGGASAAVTRSEALKEGDLTQIGTTDTGRAVYEITNKNHALYTKAYSEYKESYGAEAISFDEYVKRHGLMVIKNDAGELLIYIRDQYSVGGGCAKPVVYLYPTHTTTVSVSVGADVAISDPHYTQAGWQGVVAQPSGKLSYNGMTYDSLFWEGTGHGAYPGIVAGTVVKHDNAIATIKRQLAEQGLNAKESADFIAFWQDKIPNKPYVRLTWLTTEQDRKSTRLNSSHNSESRMPSSA
jgi:hypothetical protein